MRAEATTKILLSVGSLHKQRCKCNCKKCNKENASNIRAARGWTKDDIYVNSTGIRPNKIRTCVSSLLKQSCSVIFRKNLWIRYLYIPVGTVLTSNRGLTINKRINTEWRPVTLVPSRRRACARGRTPVRTRPPSWGPSGRPPRSCGRCPSPKYGFRKLYQNH